MEKFSLRCDNCGKFIAERDFDHGALRRLIQPDSGVGIEDWETLCIKCNKYPQEAS